MKTNYILLIILSLSISSCRKWLDVKSSLSDVTPTTLADYQAIIDNDVYLNDGGTPGLALTSIDNFYVSYTTWQSRSATERNSYIWASEIYEGANPTDWSRPYRNIENANIVLEGLASISPQPDLQVQWNNINGNAYFVRAYSLFNLMQTFAPPYIASSAELDLGVPIRLSADVNEVSVRSTVKQVYDQILSDLKAAENLLPNLPALQTRPSKAAVYAMLAKAYLNMGDFSQAFTYSDKALSLYSTLIDFNSLNANANPAFPAYPGNNEVIYFNTTGSYVLMTNTNAIVDSILYQSYINNDLRKTVLFRLNSNLPIFKGTYTGKLNSFFSGIATNELYLIRAEANARLGNTTAAMADLNTLLQKRWKTGTFIPVSASNAADALTKILTERRKELPFTGSIRWEDLRRLNQDSRFAKTLTRILNGQTYTLAPNDPKYTLPIPDLEIRLSGIQQNPR